MEKEKETKKLGCDFDLDDWERFHDWCKTHRYTKTGSATAALDLLQVLPLSLRELVMCSEWAHVSECLDRAAEMIPENLTGTAEDALKILAATDPKDRRKVYAGTRRKKKGAS